VRKQIGSWEMTPPQTIGTTTDHLWWPLSRYASVLSTFHGHSDLGVSVGA